MTSQLNPWLPAARERALRIVEDSDRRVRAHVLLTDYLGDVHRAACAAAISTERAPRLERIDAAGTIWLNFEWTDHESGWFLIFSVVREGAMLSRTLEFSGDSTEAHRTVDGPSEEQIRQALWDYFKAWQK